MKQLEAQLELASAAQIGANAAAKNKTTRRKV